MEILEFEAKLEHLDLMHPPRTFVTIPFSVVDTFGSSSSVPVRGTINGVPYKSSLRPQRDGTYQLVISQAIRKATGIGAGDWGYVSLEEDFEHRFNELPTDFLLALESNHEALEAFESMTYAHQKEIVEWILEARDYELRERRIQLALINMPEGKVN